MVNPYCLERRRPESNRCKRLCRPSPLATCARVRALVGAMKVIEICGRQRRPPSLKLDAEGTATKIARLDQRRVPMPHIGSTASED
jgi:hypothetical protein